MRKYVAAIAGLRSVAVLAIVLYHLDASWVPGGFVGVDIFFVISGFVVAHSVMSGPPQQAGFGAYVAAFYKRRFQRILPVAFLYIVVAALASLLFVPRVPATKFIEMTGAAATFALSNIVLWLKTGDYFSASSEFNFFTHTWSLAVEEQYYLFFPFFSYPLLLVSTPRRSRRLILGLVIGACAVSLVAAAVLTRWMPVFAFYMLPTRFWELGLGFLVRAALTEDRTQRIAAATRAYAGAIATLACAALALALVYTDPRAFPFPGAILPCLATALLIAAVWCHPKCWVDRLLSLRLPVWIGDISYSLYLWHWGIIVLLRWTIGIETLATKLAALVAMLALSALSYRYVERAFHNGAQRKTPPTGRFFLGYAATAVLVAGLCGTVYLAKPVIGPPAANDQAIWDPYATPPLPAECPTDRIGTAFASGKIITFPTRCVRADAPQLFIVGDSHAGAYQRAAWRIAATGRYRVTLLTLGGCRPILLSKLPEIPGCAAFLNRALDLIARTGRRGDVVVLPGLQTTRYRSPDGAPLAARALDPGVIATSRDRLARFTALKPSVIVEGAKPVAYVDLYRCADWFSRPNPACRPTGDASPAETRARLDAANRGVAMVVAGSPATLWRPDKTLCHDGLCPDYIDGRPVYFDTDHLSAFANDLVLPSLLAAVDRARAAALDAQEP